MSDVLMSPTESLQELLLGSSSETPASILTKFLHLHEANPLPAVVSAVEFLVQLRAKRFEKNDKKSSKRKASRGARRRAAMARQGKMINEQRLLATMIREGDLSDALAEGQRQAAVRFLEKLRGTTWLKKGRLRFQTRPGREIAAQLHAMGLLNEASPTQPQKKAIPTQPGAAVVAWRREYSELLALLLDELKRIALERDWEAVEQMHGLYVLLRDSAEGGKLALNLFELEGGKHLDMFYRDLKRSKNQSFARILASILARGGSPGAMKLIELLPAPSYHRGVVNTAACMALEEAELDGTTLFHLEVVLQRVVRDRTLVRSFRRRALRLLARFTSIETTRQILLIASDDPTPRVRKDAIEHFSEGGAILVMPLLHVLTRVETKTQKRCGMRILAKIGKRLARQQNAETLSASSLEEVQRIAKALQAAHRKRSIADWKHFVRRCLELCQDDLHSAQLYPVSQQARYSLASLELPENRTTLAYLAQALQAAMALSLSV